MQGLVAVKYTSLLFFDTTGEDGVVLMCTCIPSDGFFVSQWLCSCLKSGHRFHPQVSGSGVFPYLSLLLESDDCVHTLYCSVVAVASESPTLTSVKGNFQRTKWSVWILVFYSATLSIFVAYGTSFQVKTVLF